MNNRKLRIAALLCGMLLAAGTCASCTPLIVINTPDESGTGTENASDDTSKDPQSGSPDQTDPGGMRESEDTEAAAKQYLSALRSADYGGKNVLIAVTDSDAAFGEDAEGVHLRSKALSDLRAESMRAVEEKYRVKFITFTYSADDLYRKVVDSYNSDTQYVADFFCIPPRDVGRYQAKGLLYNLRSLPFTDFSCPYFDREAMRETSAGYGIWAAAGGFTDAPENAYAVYYNRKLYEELGLSSPYQTVAAGDWTWEMFFENEKNAASLDGITGSNLNTFSQARAEEIFLASSGIHMADTQLDATPTVDPPVSGMQAIADRIYSHVPAGADADAAASAEKAFADGNMLYCVSTLSRLSEWADAPADWGVLPLPKCDKEQDAYYTCRGDGCVLCVPSSTAEPEMTGVLLQALYAASYGGHTDAFLNEALCYYVRDGKSVDMLERITDSYYYDFASMFSSGYPNLSYATTDALHKTVTTAASFETYASRFRSQAEKEMQAAFPVE